MNKRRIFQKTIAWALITTMINPAFLAPAFARDSDIYLQTTTGTSAAEPNVLFILGTNDRMNVAEAWREYDPDVYDSHAEYLWNDISIINGSNFATGSESSIRISTASPPVNPTSPWGTWAGGTPTERSDLWKAVKTYATGKQGGDPVARSTLRNYWNGSWVYWLPAGSDIATDQRLWSTSYNRFQAHIQTAPGTRGNVVFPDVNAPFPYNGANGTTADYRAFNLCSGAISQITPSTVFAPTDTPMNVGFYLNQQWVRYEPYLNLTAVNSPATNYPGDHTTAFGGTNNTSAAPSIATFYRGYVDGVSGAPTNTAVAPPTNVYRDSWTSPADNPVVGGRQGQPIRIQGSGFAGWADVKADLGGFVFQSYVANSNGYYYPALELTRLRTLAYANSYNLIAAGNANGANPLELEQFSAWKGNRDGAPAFGSMVGTPAYYDVTVGSCNPSTGPAVANQCIAYGRDRKSVV